MQIDYSLILSRSFEITKRHKWLWVFGLVLVTFGAGGGGNWSSFRSFGETKKDFPPEIPKDTAHVLGQASSALGAWLSSVPPSKWFLFGTSFFLLILFVLAASWILRTWAKAALIAGVAEAGEGGQPTLLSTSPKGAAALKNLIIYSLIVFGITLALFLVIVSFFGVTYLALGGQLRVAWAVLGTLIGGLALVLALVLLAFTNIYAERLIVLKGFFPWQAWKKGLSLSRDSFLPTVVMAIINSAVGCTVGCLGTLVLVAIFAIPAILLIYPLFQGGFHWPGFPTIVSLFALIFLFINAGYLIQALLTVFSYSNWNLFFQEVWKKEECEKQS